MRLQPSGASRAINRAGPHRDCETNDVLAASNLLAPGAINTAGPYQDYETNDVLAVKDPKSQQLYY